MKQVSRLSTAFVLALIFLCCAQQPLRSAEITPTKPKYTVSPKLEPSISNESGTVELEADIDRFGRVVDTRLVSTTNKEFVDACIDAIVRWRFEPARRNGTPIASKVIQPFEFNPGTVSLRKKRNAFTQSPRAYKRVAPKVEGKHSNINGQLSFRVNLDADGEIEEIALVESTHEELVSTTIEALEKWKFSPAIEDGQSVPSKVLVPFKFVANARSREDTISNALALNKVDVEPKLIAKHEPVLPVAMEKTRGEAWLLLYIDEYGYVAQADSLKSSSKEMSRLALAAASQWKYEPAIKNGRPVASKLAVPFRSGGGALVAQLAADKKPKPVRKVSPKIPSKMSGVSGYVRVLIELDEKGDVVTASARDSSHAELNAPAVKAAENWKFKPARRDGEPVASTLILPFIFGKG